MWETDDEAYLKAPGTAVQLLCFFVLALCSFLSMTPLQMDPHSVVAFDAQYMDIWNGQALFKTD